VVLVAAAGGAAQPLVPQRVRAGGVHRPPRQRVDALVILRLNLSTPRPSVGRIPWFDGTPRRLDEVEVRLALEVDRGTEPLPILLQKAVAYRDLTAGGVYSQAFSGPVLPVVIAPNNRRAGQIAREWQTAWPDGWGVISVVRVCDHPEHGTLWGDYRGMCDGTPLPLLAALAPDARGRVRSQPVASLERWRQGMGGGGRVVSHEVSPGVHAGFRLSAIWGCRRLRAARRSGAVGRAR
jgi:hypothetical protein